MTDLTDINGVGPSYAEELSNNGYESVQDVADADADELDELIATIDGNEVVENATALADVDDSDDSGDEAFEIDPDFDDDQERHLIAALVAEEIRRRKTNDLEGRSVVTDAIDQVRAGQPYEFTMDQLDATYRAVSQLEKQYRSERGISQFTTKIRNMKTYFQEQRSKYWNDE